MATYQLENQTVLLSECGLSLVDETPMVDFLAGFLRGKGLTVELQPVVNPTLECVKGFKSQQFAKLTLRIRCSPNVRRENVYAYIGSNRQCKMIVNSHTDVVPPVSRKACIVRTRN